MMDLEPMPNRLNGIMPRSLYTFRNGVPKTEYLTKICGFSALCMFNEVQSTSAPRIFELPHMQVIMTISREQLGYQLTPIVSPAVIRRAWPAYHAVMEKRYIRWVSCFCCTSSHSITLPKNLNIVQAMLTTVSCKNKSSPT